MHRNQVYWRCRRGVLELDVLFNPFFEQCYDTLSSDQQSLFIDLLAEEDPELQQWLIYGKDIPDNFSALISQVKAHASG